MGKSPRDPEKPQALGEPKGGLWLPAHLGVHSLCATGSLSLLFSLLFKLALEHYARQINGGAKALPSCKGWLSRSWCGFQLIQEQGEISIGLRFRAP